MRKPKMRKPPKHHTPTDQPLDKYEKEDIRDAMRTRKWLAGEDMSREDKWIVKEKNIPCAWYAISVLAPQNGIKCLSRHAIKSRYDGYWHALAIVKKGDGKFASTRSGAGRYHEEKIALCFACRNAIKWLLPQQPDAEKMAYRDTQDNAIQFYA